MNFKALVMAINKETLIDLEDLILHFEQPQYYCVSIEEDTFGNEAERIFLSKNKVEKDGDTFTMPEWYAEKKGLL